MSEPRRKRGAERTSNRGPAAIPQLPLRRVENPYPPMALLSADQIEAIQDRHIVGRGLEVGVHLARLDIPTLLVQPDADNGVFPSQAAAIFDTIAAADKDLCRGMALGVAQARASSAYTSCRCDKKTINDCGDACFASLRKVGYPVDLAIDICKELVKTYG